MRFLPRVIMFSIFMLYVLPLAVSAGAYWVRGRHADWRSADRSSAGLLKPPTPVSAALVRVFSARTVSWRGIVATHSWIVIKDRGAPAYQRFDYTAWGEPIWRDRFVPDGRWFGNPPEVVFMADEDEAARMIPVIRKAIRQYRYPHPGDYRLWPGPNSNTFVAAIMQAARMKGVLPPTAIGKDYPYDGHWIGPTPSGTGLRINAGGYLGLSIGWYEGIECNVLGAVVGIDLRRVAIKLPGLGRLGLPLYQPSSSSQAADAPASLKSTL